MMGSPWSSLRILLNLHLIHAVQGRIPIILDGGIIQGMDMFKALAFGAQVVLDMSRA